MGRNERPNLLVYDPAGPADREQAGRLFGSGGVVALPAGSVEELAAGLDRLVSGGGRFDRAVFQSHGGPGRAWFGRGALTAASLREGFAGRGYHLLFPWGWTRIYFDGCNAAQGADGADFLRAAGEVFLRSAGGFASGWEGAGGRAPGAPASLLWGGLKLWGRLKTVAVGPGGAVIPPGPDPCSGRVEGAA
jgi:hypothetical protein